MITYLSVPNTWEISSTAENYYLLRTSYTSCTYIIRQEVPLVRTVEIENIIVIEVPDWNRCLGITKTKLNDNSKCAGFLKPRTQSTSLMTLMGP
jgi:hypothetical protein